MSLAPLLAALLRDPELEAALAELAVRVATRLRAELPAAVEPPRMLTAAELGKRLGISTATIRRLDPPCVVVGDARSRRFDLDEVRSWLAARTPAPTTPATAARREPDLDVGASLRGAGLRVVSPRRTA
jgi:hypothetical protein